MSRMLIVHEKGCRVRLDRTGCTCEQAQMEALVAVVEAARHFHAVSGTDAPDELFAWETLGAALSRLDGAT